MSEMIVKLKWDGEKMGPMWMNEDNLKHLLFGPNYTSDEFLECEVLSHSEMQPRIAFTIPIPFDTGEKE